MPVRYFFIECSLPFWIEIAEYLKQEYEWIPIYWSGTEEVKEGVINHFPNIYFHPNKNAVRGIPHKNFANNKLYPIDKHLLKNLSYCQSITLQMMDRMDRNEIFSFQERLQLFYLYVRYWNTILKKLKPDVSIFPVSPHLAYDYVLYSLCKLRNIPTMMFVQTSLNYLIYPVQQFEQGSSELRKEYNKILNKDYNSVVLSKNSKQYINKMQGKYSNAVPFYMKNQFEKSNPILFLIKEIVTKPNHISDLIKKGRYLFSRNHYIKEPGKPIRNSNMKGMKYIYIEVEGVRKKNYLKKFYNQIIEPFNEDIPFIYFPLHYQPERTSCPEGEIFSDQFLIIDMISKLLPYNWQLYVKEHTSQWHPLMHGECSRDKSFYEKVRSLENVHFLSTQVSSFKLTDKAKAVATITGTSGWEALIRETPALVFGHAWYKDCHGAFSVESIEDCKKAISLIANGFSIDLNKVKAFLKALENAGIKAYVGEGYKTATDISYEENIKNISKCIYSYIKKTQ
ncbi:MAG: hypothetical protein GF317_22055 [Candidatus Lokiarchaeota archaeon]|nr:hypothetical protein [Candidatus Lokiarchaeota archaeon]